MTCDPFLMDFRSRSRHVFHMATLRLHFI